MIVFNCDFLQKLFRIFVECKKNDCKIVWGYVGEKGNFGKDGGNFGKLGIEYILI